MAAFAVECVCAVAVEWVAAFTVERAGVHFALAGVVLPAAEIAAVVSLTAGVASAVVKLVAWPNKMDVRIVNT